MAKDFIDRAHVIIMESPSPKDILRNHREGGALAKMLDLAGVKSDYYEVVNGEMFDLGMDMAIDAAVSRGQEPAPSHAVAPNAPIKVTSASASSARRDGSRS
jgi:hypothetical protein